MVLFNAFIMGKYIQKSVFAKMMISRNKIKEECGMWKFLDINEGRIPMIEDARPIVIPIMIKKMFSEKINLNNFFFEKPRAISIAISCFLSIMFLYRIIPIPIVPIMRPNPPNIMNTDK